jgi:hypothetical protein
MSAAAAAVDDDDDEATARYAKNDDSTPTDFMVECLFMAGGKSRIWNGFIKL